MSLPVHLMLAIYIIFFNSALLKQTLQQRVKSCMHTSLNPSLAFMFFFCLPIRHLSAPRRTEWRLCGRPWECYRRGISGTGRLDEGAVPAFLPERLIPASLRFLARSTRGREWGFQSKRPLCQATADVPPLRSSATCQLGLTAAHPASPIKSQSH